MHPGAFEFISRFATNEVISIIEIGSRDINGTVRSLFPAASWTGLDLYPGPAVDVVTDAMDYVPGALVDRVVCCEVFEHSQNWGEILTHAATWIRPGGRMLITCAGPGREPHSAIDGGKLRPGEHYENISVDSLAEELHYAGFVEISMDWNNHWQDTYADAKKALT
jgi:cyclopropane fatty-acyl-phospholipid synthase-like methyltransferase